MNAEVIDLDARRPEPARRCSCKPNDLCYPHRLTNLADLLRAELDGIDALIVDRATVDRLTAHVFAVVDEIADECLTSERTAR